MLLPKLVKRSKCADDSTEPATMLLAEEGAYFPFMHHVNQVKQVWVKFFSDYLVMLCNDGLQCQSPSTSRQNTPNNRNRGIAHESDHTAAYHQSFQIPSFYAWLAQTTFLRFLSHGFL